jgi:hypothetical protein
VPGGVGQDELAPRGGEVAVGDVDRDPLLALGAQAVDQQREVELAGAGVPVPRRVLLQRGQVVVGDQPGVVEQAADQRALAVVDAAAGDEAQQVLAVVVLEEGVDAPRRGAAPGRSVAAAAGAQK